MPNALNPLDPNNNPIHRNPNPNQPNPTSPNQPPIAPPPHPKADPIAAMDARLRPQLNPATELEEVFFHQVVVSTVLGNFLMNHIADDPNLEHPETTRRIRLLHANQSRLRYHYDELRRLQIARRLQQRDPALAAESLDLIVATHTTRAGLRAKPLPFPSPTAHDAPKTVANAPTPGRNAQCPCGSGRKFKHCCLNRPSTPLAA